MQKSKKKSKLDMSSKMLKKRGAKRLQKRKRIRINQSLQKVEANQKIN